MAALCNCLALSREFTSTKASRVAIGRRQRLICLPAGVNSSPEQPQHLSQPRSERHMDARWCTSLASEGNLPLLKRLRSLNPPIPWSETTCKAAARKGHLHVLRYLRSCDPPCPWSEDVCNAAAGAGQLGTLQWALQNGCELGGAALQEAEGNRYSCALKLSPSKNVKAIWFK